jgi:hypothetical protein
MWTDPVGTGEIADRLGYKHQTVRAWGTRGLLPEPKRHIGGRPIWDWPTIEAWAKETGRFGGSGH